MGETIGCRSTKYFVLLKFLVLLCFSYMKLVAKLVDRYLILIEDSTANTANGETLDLFRKELEDAINSKEASLLHYMHNVSNLSDIDS